MSEPVELSGPIIPDRKVKEDRLIIHYPPLAQFEGDHQISPEMYGLVMENWYLPVGEVVVRTAASAGIKTTEEQRERLKRTMSAAFWLDNFLDESADAAQALQLYREGINYMRGNLPDPPELPPEVPMETAWAVELLRNSVSDISEKEREEMLQIAERMGEITWLKAQVASTLEYQQLVAEEGCITGRLLGLALLGEESLSPLSAQFMAWLERAVSAATLLDSGADLKKDHFAGRTSILPTVRNRLRLGAAGIHMASRGVHKFGRKAFKEARTMRRLRQIDIY